jgi:hypothetical protein
MKIPLTIELTDEEYAALSTVQRSEYGRHLLERGNVGQRVIDSSMVVS